MLSSNLKCIFDTCTGPNEQQWQFFGGVEGLQKEQLELKITNMTRYFHKPLRSTHSGTY